MLSLKVHGAMYSKGYIITASVNPQSPNPTVRAYTHTWKGSQRTLGMKRRGLALLLMKKRKSCPPGQMQSLGRGVSCEFTCTLRNPGIIVYDGGYKICGKLSACTIAHPPQFVLVSITA